MFLSIFLATYLVLGFSGTDPSSPLEVGTRSCAPGYEEITKKKHSNAPGKKKTTEEADVRECLEVKGSPLEVQEYLQKLAWEMKWNAQDEQTSEELWSISFALSREELLAYAKPFADPQVEWHAGKAAINARTTGLPDGFTRVIVTAKFEGFGAQKDQFAPKRNSWPLLSNGTLETKIAESLQAHFKPVR